MARDLIRALTQPQPAHYPMKMPKTRGLFITFEGTEGAGKSTVIQTLAQQFQSLHLPLVVTREPGGTPVAEKIRSTILDHEMNPETEALLYAASRAEHYFQTLAPALEAGKLILCDRFVDSSLAYQAHARGLDWDHVKDLSRFGTRGLSPDLTVWLDIDPAIGLARANDRNRFEEEGLKFQEKVHAGYERAMNQEPDRFFRLETKEHTPEELSASILDQIKNRFPKRFEEIQNG